MIRKQCFVGHPTKHGYSLAVNRYWGRVRNISESKNRRLALRCFATKAVVCQVVQKSKEDLVLMVYVGERETGVLQQAW